MSYSRNVMKQESRPPFICFVCGSPSGEVYTLYSKPKENGPYFSFLELHQPPNGSVRPSPDGVVASCYLCFSFLIQQWESYERNGTALSKRIYWLKRNDNGPFAGMDSGAQSDYATSYLGLVPPTNHMTQQDKRDAISPEDTMSQSTLGSQYNKPDYPEPLDCTIEEPSRMNPVQRFKRSEASESSSVLDLSVQTRSSSNIVSLSPNASILTCYACGEDAYRGTLINIFTKPISNCPYFPNLWSHPKPSKAKPIDSMGKVEVCELCHKYLIRQWEAYQRGNVPNNERQYHIRSANSFAMRENVLASNQSNANTNQFFCFTCGQEYPKSVRRELKTRPSSDGEPYFTFLEKSLPAPGARPITIDGRAMVCTLCSKALARQFRVYDLQRTPEEHRTYKIPAEFIQESNVLRDRLLGHSRNERPPSTLSLCYLCDRPSNNWKSVDTLQSQSCKMYFPFIREIAKPVSSDPLDNLGRCTICLTCYLLLQTQWEAFQNAQVPINQRHYSLNYAGHNRQQTIDITTDSPPPMSNQESGKNHNAALHIQVTLPDEQSSVNHQNVAHEPLLTTVTTMSYTSVITTPSRHIPTHPPPVLVPFKDPPEQSRQAKSLKENLDDSPDNPANPRIYNPLELPSTKQPLMVATTCFICGECSAPGFTYPISVYPSRSPSSDDYTPFFPFLSKHTKPTAADNITEDGTILGCTFCFHSLMAQWLAYETSPHAEDANHWTRKYNCHHYVCYICGITTYRKRARAITVRDFPFLVEHPRPPGSLTTQNGESVLTCLTCFESLMSQWKDFERMKLPVEMRKYNWIPIPPPPDDVNLIDPATRQQNLSRGSTPNPSSRTPPSHGTPSTHQSSQDGSNRHDNQSSLGHGVSKPNPSMLNMQQPHPSCNNTPKPMTVRSMATAVSPLYPVGPPPSHAPHSGAPNHNLGIYGGNPAAAYNAARTSSFAAALRKLAKQAVDPATEKDLSPITPVSSPAYSQRSTTPKRSLPQGVYMNNVHHSHPNRLSSPPPSNNSSMGNSHHDGQKPLDLGSVSSRESNGNRLSEPLKLDNKYDKRDDHYPMKDLSSSILQSRGQISRLEDHPSPILPTTSSSGRGFQPYRGLDDNNRHSLSSHSHGSSSHQHPPPQSHHLPSHFEHSTTGYPYPSAFLPPPHLAHPGYRFEDPVFLEHYSSMLRPPSLIHPLSQAAALMPHGHGPPPPVPQPSAAPSSVPFFPSNASGAHYSRDLMISQAQNSVNFVSPGNSVTNHDSRLKYDDRMTNRDTYSSEQDAYDRREHANRRLSDQNSDGNNEQRSSPMQPLHLSRHLESPGGEHRLGSITHGTPRDHHHSSSLGPLPQPVRSPESPNGGASTPLNLAIHHHPSSNSNQDLHRSRHHDVELWVARQANNTVNNVTSQNHHVQERHERYSPAPPSHPPPPLLSAQPPSTLSGSQHPQTPLEHHQVSIRSEYQHPSNTINYHLQPSGSSQEDINRHQFHMQQQFHLQRQPIQHRKHSSSHIYNSNNEASRSNHYEKVKHKIHTSKIADSIPVSLAHSNQNHAYNGALSRVEDGYNRSALLQRDREQNTIVDSSRSTEKAVTLDRWAYYHQEGMQSRLMELEKPVIESKEPPSLSSHSFAYSQHQPNASMRDFQVASRSGHTESNCVDILVSKLDLEEAQLKKARMDGTYVTDSEGSENDDEKLEDGSKLIVRKNNPNANQEPWLDWGPRGLRRPFILLKGPPLQIDCDPHKMEILKSVGLTTVKRKKELELEKFLKRQQQLKDPPPIQVIESEDQENRRPFPVSIIVSSLSMRQPLTSNYSVKKSISENGKSKWQQKNFMESLKLRANQDENREEQEIIWKVIIEERCKRHRITLPLTEICETNCVSSNYGQDTNDSGTRGIKRKNSDSLFHHSNGLVCDRSNTETLQSAGSSKNVLNSVASPMETESKPYISPSTNHVSDYHSKKYLNPRSNIPSLQPVMPIAENDACAPPSVPPPLIPTGRASKSMTVATLDSEKRVVFLTTPTSKSNAVSSILSPVTLFQDKSVSGLKPPPLNNTSSRQTPREFAQKFHQSVLQATRQQLENTITRESSTLPVPPLLHNISSSNSQNHVPISQYHPTIGASYSGMPKLANYPSTSQVSSVPSTSSFSESHKLVKQESNFQDSFNDRDSDGCLKWPGIEIIMESYEKHRKEQNLEKEFLGERCQVNQSHSQDLKSTADVYSQRMAELCQLKRHMDEERQRHQSAIDSLKKCLRQIR